MITSAIEAIYPLSPMQEGMLFHTLYTPESDVYRVQTRYRLRGDLDIPAFERAWQYIIERHPILRTVIVWEKRDQPLQVVYQKVDLPMTQHDWRDLSASEQQTRLAAFLEADREQGFALDTTPPIRLNLIRIADDQYDIIWSLHHILLDGWSVALLYNEMLTSYEAFCQNRDVHLDPSPPYRDYIGWLQRQDLSKAEAFWRRALEGFAAPTPLGVGQNAIPQPLRADEQEIQDLRFPEAETAALQSFAQHHRLTLNTLLQGAWSLLLSRYSGEQDVVFGATVSGRPAALAGVESIAGLFINTLPVRVQIAPGISVLSWLQQLQEQLVEIQQYDYSSLIQIQGWSDVPRGLPLFESILDFENHPSSATSEIQNGRLEVIDTQRSVVGNFPLAAIILPGRELHLRFLYQCARFDTATIERMLGHVKTLLEGFMAFPEHPLSALPLLTASEQSGLLVTPNATQTAYPQDQCIHHLIEAQVERTPDAIAVMCEGDYLTYRALDQRANQVGHALQALGVGPDIVVGLLVDRSVELVVGLLGILKAGGAYLPLDPAHPPARLAFLVADSQASVVLTKSATMPESLPHEVQVLCLDTDWASIAQAPIDRTDSEVTPLNLAYSIYTSGSTGQPKGVMNEHRRLVNYICGINHDLFRHTGHDIALLSSITFDITLKQLFSPLLLGGKVWVLPDHTAQDPVALVDALRAHPDAVLNCMPSLWEAMLDSMENDRATTPPPRLSALFVGGDSPTQTFMERTLDILPGLPIWNVYGPTEATGAVSAIRVFPGGDVSVGRPFANTQLYVLDPHLQPVPVGVTGELHIGGARAARGYRNLPGLTAGKFVPDPFTTEPGARLYKTGDLVSYLPNSTIAFLGRGDSQVKLRGFRVELGEIETVLSQHPEIREAVVIVAEAPPGDQRLVAYATSIGQPDPTPAALRTFLEAQLPNYMIPNRFVFLDTLPVNPMGKIDRRALPAADHQEPLAVSALPRTPVEEVLVQLCAAVLGVEQVGVHDNFFELGGHSLLATQFVSRIRAALQIELLLADLFETQTVSGIAEVAEKALSAGQGEPPPPLHPMPRTGDIPLSLMQQRLWFLDQLEPLNPFYNIPGAIRFRGSLDVAALDHALNTVMQRHEALRTTFSQVDDRPVQIVHATQPLTLSVIDLRLGAEVASESLAQHIAVSEARRPFILEHGPLVRATLLRLGTDDHVFLLIMHHIISDGWSVGICLRELTTLYMGLTTGQPTSLPALPLQYPDFAIWQQQWLQGGALETQLAYWKDHLQDAPAVLQLPTDRPRPDVQTYQGAQHLFTIDSHLYDALQAMSRREGVTLFMTLLAAFTVLLHRYSGQHDITVGSPIAGRNRPEAESLVGFFINTLVLRLNVAENPSVREFLEQVRTVCLGAYAHQDVPFEMLVEALKPERDLQRTPLTQVLFALHNIPWYTPKVPGLTLEPVEFDAGTSKYDLTVLLTPREGQLHGMWKYNTDLFEAATMDRMLSHFQTVLESFVTDPGQPVWHVPLFSQAERHQLLTAWNATAADTPAEPNLNVLFEAQVARRPHAVAGFEGDAAITYADLNQRANQLAHHLRQLGVGPEVRVGLCMERSLPMLVSVLGILKAGGAYVPLDPAYPAERLAFIVSDANVPVLVTRKHLRSVLPEHAAQVVDLDTDAAQLARASTANPNVAVTPDTPAYVLYTSGSTGVPKGVLGLHGGTLNRFAWMWRTYPFEAGEVSAQKASLNFGDAVWELFGPLLQGIPIAFIPDEVLLEPSQFVHTLARHRVSRMVLVPSLLRLLLSYEGDLQAGIPHLKLWSCSGEALTGDLVQRFRQSLPDRTLLNLYGTSEVSADVTWFDTHQLGDDTEHVPIGRPLANTQIYILDPQGQPVPVGVPGELYIGGMGLGRGYLHQPELTAEKFVPDPFSGSGMPGARLYKPGDVARYRPDGNIEYLGRVDHQVQVRGFRIELGEIESTLTHYPKVREAAVVARSETADDLRLTAYVVASQEGEAPASRELRDFLSAHLPDYMVPAAFVMLDTLPQTPSGKLDRRALMALESAQPALDNPFVAPRTPVEVQLAELWSDLLGVEQISVYDNFFEIGGHSLLAAQLIGRLRRQYQVSIPLRMLFEVPTLEAMSGAITAQQIEKADTEEVVKMVKELQQLTPEQVQALLETEKISW